LQNVKLDMFSIAQSLWGAVTCEAWVCEAWVCEAWMCEAWMCEAWKTRKMTTSRNQEWFS